MQTQQIEFIIKSITWNEVSIKKIKNKKTWNTLSSQTQGVHTHTRSVQQYYAFYVDEIY